MYESVNYCLSFGTEDIFLEIDLFLRWYLKVRDDLVEYFEGQ